MRRVISIDLSKCTGCRICEVVCSLKHVGECNPERSLIRVIMSEEGGQLDFVPAICLQCEKPFCELVCPTGAINENPQTGAREINTQKCIGCSACSYACPFGACFVDRTLHRVVVCDLCNGDPACVKLCPVGALQYVRVDEINIALKRAGTQRLLQLMGRQVGY